MWQRRFTGLLAMSLVVSFIILLTFLVPAVPGALRAAPTNLVVNGSFESPAVTWGSFQLFEDEIPGWLALDIAEPSNLIEIQNHWSAYHAADGDQYVELDARESTRISQIVPTTPNQPYFLSFGFSARPGESEGNNRLIASWNLKDVVALKASGSDLSKPAWFNSGVCVAGSADGNETFLEFADAGVSDSKGTFIDNVVVIESNCDPATQAYVQTGPDTRLKVDGQTVPPSTSQRINVGSILGGNCSAARPCSIRLLSEACQDLLYELSDLQSFGDQYDLEVVLMEIATNCAPDNSRSLADQTTTAEGHTMSLALNQGGLTSQNLSGRLQLELATKEATIDSAGTCSFSVVRNSQARTTTVTSYTDGLVVTPENPALLPIGLDAWQQVTLSFDAAAPVVDLHPVVLPVVLGQ